MGRKKKEDKSKLSFDVDEGFEDVLIGVRPEDFVAMIAEGRLPPEYRPYDDYIPKLPKFIDDERPDRYQFREDGSRWWEVINDGDPDITPVYFSMPTPPELSFMDNHELPQDEQYFRRQEIPIKLRQIEKKALIDLYSIEKRNRQDTVQGYKFYLKFWELIDQEKDKLAEEIIWLGKMWWYRTYGYWYYNDGEPTFLPPDYFDFLNFYYMDEAVRYPEYRDDVRRKYCYAWYLETTTETFVDIDPETGKAVKVDGKYRMKDLGRRLFFGDCEPKTRRTGATHEAIHKILKGAITNMSYFSTIVSFEGNNAEVHYKKKLLPAFDAYPMCLKPMWEGNRRPTVLRLDAPPNVYHIKGLKSAVMFSDSGGLFKNEGDRLNGLLNDEQGKDSNLKVNIFERWNINKYTMSTGMGINILKGVYVKNPSTVEQMESNSAPYYRLCMMSDFYRRLPVKGQTSSGFARIFFPAYLRMEGFIDKFGKSVLDTPTERQVNLYPYSIFAVDNKGAKEMLQAERDSLVAENTPRSLEQYRSVRRKSPFTWSECWLGASGNVGYNLEILDKRLGELNKLKSFGKMPYKMGYFDRENKNDKFSKVIWVTDLDKPKFKMSMDLPTNMTNRIMRSESWDYTRAMVVPSLAPVEGYRFTLGVDAFRNINKTEAKNAFMMGTASSNSRQSDGGLCMLWEYDESIDKGRSKYDWETDRIVLTYRWRPATWNEFIDDVILSAVYYGAMIYPEYNVEAVVKDIIDAGYGGFLLFDLDLMTGKPKPMPGRYTDMNTWQEVMPMTKDYIEFHGHKENHDDLLMEFKNLKGIEDFTHKDLHAAFGMARLGSKSRFRQFMQTQDSDNYLDLDGAGFRKKRF